MVVAGDGSLQGSDLYGARVCNRAKLAYNGVGDWLEGTGPLPPGIEAEDAAKKVERQVEKSTAAMLLEARIGERFEAIVTGASDKGTWVRLLHPPVEGKLVTGFAGMDVGQKLWVQLTRTDVERGYIDFERVG